MAHNISVTEGIHIKVSPEKVFDYTQDYANRPNWDSGILHAEVLQENPVKLVQIYGKGGFKCKFQYKLFDRPNKTSLTMIDVTPKFISSGGGSWIYRADGVGTAFVQHNTLSIENKFLFYFFKPILTWQLRRNTKRSMRMVKETLENQLATG